MKSINQEIYKFISKNKEGLAEKILSRQLLYQPELNLKYTDYKYKKYLNYSYQLSYLSEAISMNTLELFNDYIVWVKLLIQGLNIPTEELLTINLNCIKDILSSELSEEMGIITNYFIDTAIENILTPFISSKTFLCNNNVYFDILTEYLDLVLKTERIKASKLIIDGVEKGISIKDIYVYVFEPALKEIDRLWQTNKITVAQEHYFTVTTQFIMSQLYSRIFSSTKNGLKFVGACVDEDLHEVGHRMVSDILEIDEWDTYYLGVNVPKSDLISFLIDHKPHVLGISATMTFHLHKVIELIEEVRNTEELKEIKILVGGYPFNLDKGLWKEVGADLYSPNAIETSDLLSKNFRVVFHIEDKIDVTKRIDKEIVNINIQEMNAIRLGIKEMEDTNWNNSLKEDQILNEMSELNNQLINMQRELAKKNIELEKLNHKLNQLSITDPLTGLYNRRYFFDKIIEEITRAKRGNYKLVLISIDLNNFKKVNDNYGHDEGDRVLREFANEVRMHIRSNIDSVYRFGGVFCKYFFMKVANYFSIVLQLEFPQCCK